MDDSDTVIDVVAYEGKTWPGLINTSFGALNGQSIERDPSSTDTDNISIDFSIRENDGTPGLVMQLCEGNFDNDTDVDDSDLAVFAENFGRTDCGTGPLCEGDFEPDGDVDGSDIALFAAEFGRADCPVACGDGFCSSGENPDNCSIDCPVACGDGFCSSGENPNNCSIDCPVACGDGFCSSGEDASNCSADCPSATCGDGFCDPGEGEDVNNCSADCPA